MWRRVVLPSTDVVEERVVSITRMKRIGDLVTALAVTSNWSHLMLPTTPSTLSTLSYVIYLLKGQLIAHLPSPISLVFHSIASFLI
jgi:hypothetical protein